jgi:hypothetical protein
MDQLFRYCLTSLSRSSADENSNRFHTFFKLCEKLPFKGEKAECGVLNQVRHAHADRLLESKESKAFETFLFGSVMAIEVMQKTDLIILANDYSSRMKCTEDLMLKLSPEIRIAADMLYLQKFLIPALNNLIMQKGAYIQDSKVDLKEKLKMRFYINPIIHTFFGKGLGLVKIIPSESTQQELSRELKRAEAANSLHDRNLEAEIARREREAKRINELSLTAMMRH